MARRVRIHVDIRDNLLLPTKGKEDTSHLLRALIKHLIRVRLRHHRSNMATTRLRKTFHYPTDDEDAEMEEGLDEQGMFEQCASDKIT